MRPKSRYVVYGFATTHDALAAEQALMERGSPPFVTVPTPKVLGTLCGIALRLLPEHAPEAELGMREAGLQWSGSAEVEDW